MQITVIVPVGPHPGNKRYLPECLYSIGEQYRPVQEVLIIDDQAHLSLEDIPASIRDKTRIWKTPWLSGVAHAFNFGVALATHEHVFMLGSDDLIYPWCMNDCERAYESTKRDNLIYYAVDVEYSDGRQQSLPCHAAMVTKSLFELNGGFPVESAVGAPDTMLLSIMLGNSPRAGRILQVKSDKPPYYYRVHDETDTATRGSRYTGVMTSIRDILTKTWEPATWTRR